MHLSEATFQKLLQEGASEDLVVPRGMIEVKGKGRMQCAPTRSCYNTAAHQLFPNAAS